jgi:hypothetical protein
LDNEANPLLALGTLAAVIEGLGPDLLQDDRLFLASYLHAIADSLQQGDEHVYVLQ